MMSKDCVMCGITIEVEKEKDFIISMDGAGPHCEYCWDTKLSIGADAITSALGL
jgi:hypothetical protein